MTETEITETEVTEPEEHVENPAAVLKKNRELLSDLRAAKERSSSLEELARTLGLDDAALADPRAHIAKRAEDTKAAKERNQTIRDAALKTIASEQRIVKGDIEELLAKVAADPAVKIDDAGKVDLGDVLSRVAPKRASPMNPANPPRGWDAARGVYVSANPSPASYEELQRLGAGAVESFASKSPEAFAKLRADWQTRLANPTGRK